MSPAALRWDDWVPGAQQYAEQVATIPGVAKVRRALLTKRESIPPQPPVLIVTEDRLMAKYFHGSLVQLILVDLCSHACAADVAEQATTLLLSIVCHSTECQEGLMSSNAGIVKLLKPSRTEPPTVPPAVANDRDRPLPRIAMDYTPIDGALELSRLLLDVTGVDFVRISTADERVDGQSERSPITTIGKQHVVVTAFSATHQQQLLVFPSTDTLLNDLRKSVAAVASQQRHQKEVSVVSPPKPDVHPVTAPNPPAITVSTNSSSLVHLTPQQAESYAFALTLIPAGASESEVVGLSGKLARHFNEQGSNRYTSLMSKKVIERRNGKTIVVRKPYTSETVKHLRTISPPPPGTSPSPAPAPDIPVPTSATPTSAAETHFDFLREHWAHLRPARQLVSDGDQHIESLRKLGWTVVEIGGELLLRRIVIPTA